MLRFRPPVVLSATPPQVSSVVHIAHRHLYGQPTEDSYHNRTDKIATRGPASPQYGQHPAKPAAWPSNSAENSRAPSAWQSRGRGGSYENVYRKRAPSSPEQAASSHDSVAAPWEGASAEPPSSSSSTTTALCRSFWSQSVRHVPGSNLKRQHVMERTHDKRSRFLVRSRIREDGVQSNIFPIHFPEAATHKAKAGNGEVAGGAHLYIYEMYVTRAVPPRPTKTPPAASATAAAGVVHTEERRVSPGRSWQAIQRYLRHRYAAAAAALLPPLIQLENKIYAAAPLPAEVLRLPKTYFDVGWKTAELRLVARSKYTDLPASELQMVVNKIVLEVASEMQRSAQRRAAAASSTNSAVQNRDGSEASRGGAEGEDEDAGVMEVVREKTGKLVCTMQGVSSGGLRVYRGVYVRSVFIDPTSAVSYEGDNEGEEGEGGQSAGHTTRTGAPPAGAAGVASSPSPAPTLTTRHLADTPVGLTAAQNPVHFCVEAFLRAFTYRGTSVESYRISDASGSVLASLWAPTEPQSLRVGAVYAAAPVRIREFAERGNARLVEVPRGTVPVLITPPPPPPSPVSTSAQLNKTQHRPQHPRLPSKLPGHISLKIDTKGTIASETSLWGEVLQHYGAGPYDEPTQQRIRKALVNMPVVISYSLRQGVVREVRFDGDALLAAASAAATVDPMQGTARDVAVSNAPSPAAAAQAALVVGATAETMKSVTRMPIVGAREPRLLPLLPFLDAQQPCAVLTDYTVVPLQVLHCCFDPTMRGWQDISIAVLSLMPNQRMVLLNFVRKLLARGLRSWGIDVALRPWRTKALSVLPAPVKSVAPRLSAHTTNAPNAAAFPTTMVILGVAGPRCTADQAQRISLTTQHMAKYFRTNRVAVLADESAGVQYVHEQLMHVNCCGAERVTDNSTASVRDVNSCVIVVTAEPDTRATRWLKVECLSRGIHLLAVAPAASPRRLNLLGGGVRRQLTTQFEIDPLRGVDLRREVPVLGRRRVLIVGVDTCHTNTRSIGTIVGILSTPVSNHLLSRFWLHDARGRETSYVAAHFKTMLQKTVMQYGGVDEVVVFQDGDVFSELAGMKDELAAQLPGCGLTFMCLHKRCNVRFTHTSSSSSAADVQNEAADSASAAHSSAVAGGYHNMVKGVVVAALAPVPLDFEVAAPSFYLQTHESIMSTARAVEYTVHHVSPTLDVADVQQMANVMANVLAPQATKLPMSTRCAHKLAERAERLLDAVPQFTGEMIPRPLCDRLWFI